jgi:hypothetical protein
VDHTTVADEFGRLTAELQARFDDVSGVTIVSTLSGALRDLQGSVRNEALPEMAVRLAVQRLDPVGRA